MIRLLLKIWPALLPILVFVVWLLLSRRRQEPATYDAFLEKKKKYMYYTIISSLVLVIVMLLYNGLSQPSMQHMEINSDQVQNNSNVH